MKQKEIWLVCLDPTVGAEIRKTRPCVILNDDAIGILPLKVIAPITDHKDKYDDVPWMIRIDPQEQNNLGKISVVDTFQPRSVAQERLIRRVGVLSDREFEGVLNALKIVFGMI